MIVDDALLDALDPALLQDAMQRVAGGQPHCGVGTRLKPMGHVETITGFAATMRLTHVGRQGGDGRRKVMTCYDELRPRSMLVLQVEGDPGGGVIGDLVAHRLSRIGVLGAVVDGPVRDVSGILARGFLVWAREATLRGMNADELRVEVGCDVEVNGIVVGEGDLVSAGRDGICVVKAGSIGAVLAAAQRLVDEENEAHRKIGNGQTILQAYPNIRS